MWWLRPNKVLEPSNPGTCQGPQSTASPWLVTLLGWGTLFHLSPPMPPLCWDSLTGLKAELYSHTLHSLPRLRKSEGPGPHPAPRGDGKGTVPSLPGCHG